MEYKFFFTISLCAIRYRHGRFSRESCIYVHSTKFFRSCDTRIPRRTSATTMSFTYGNKCENSYALLDNGVVLIVVKSMTLSFTFGFGLPGCTKTDNGKRVTRTIRKRAGGAAEYAKLFRRLLPSDSERWTFSGIAFPWLTALRNTVSTWGLRARHWTWRMPVCRLLEKTTSRSNRSALPLENERMQEFIWMASTCKTLGQCCLP